MRLLNLTIHNWGVFRDLHDFNLEPVLQPDGTYRHLTVISGHNGTGKSTLFQALMLALHGSLALGDRVSRQAYDDFLLSRLHRYSTDDATNVSETGGVTLSFRYVHSGRPLCIQVKRNWRRNGRSVLETLAVSQDGKPPDVDPADYQAWLNDLVPPGTVSLCFFDAEQLDTLTNPGQHDRLLSQTLGRLLGLDLVERLQADLEYYTLRRGGGQKTERLHAEISQHQATLGALEAQLTQLQAAAEALDTVRTDLEADLLQQEHRLAAEGGAYAARRPVLQKRLAEIQQEIEKMSEELRELGAGLMPFALVPELCQALSQRLNREVESQRWQIAAEFWQERANNIESVLQGDDLWQGLDVPLDARQALSRRIVHRLREPGAFYVTDRESLIHRLAQPEHEQLQKWIAQALHAVPEQVQVLGQRLRELRAERSRIEIDLQRAPDDELLAPIHAEIMRLEAALAEVRQQRRSLDEQIGALRFQHDEQARQRQRAAEQLATIQANERQLALAEQSKLVLRAYQDALTRQRLAALEKALVAAFNAICRKERLLAAVHINPDDFRVLLQGADGHVLSLDDLSVGERQLYALSLLWALRQVSGRKLPLVVDTPLARLDEVHREHLMHDYIPAVSDQVVLFVTGTELDSGLLAQVKPYLARAYRLDYDPQGEETVVTHDTCC